MSDNTANTVPVENTYTQREWDRVVGIGTVPEEYKKRIDSNEEKLRRYDKG